ncbi:hypothetical protein DSCO28_73710 (plasmid) [Desulfosarcina ovata subsp. sediminis]|uniref:Replication protein n=1 Tax=Desulfosarcina ovata subsp. sediminis TaxID=885957 RepID=A0A5K8A2J3_9BACT|nr:hypothetical protein [Desulfosarcina ovata]BBO86805.1 hypothetical protein DSCO28_73710 [Desulfosarcina ovata subsp. sediminis]
MTKKRKEPEQRKPPIKPVKCIQLELFSDFVSNDKDTISNTVEFWESIPKYFFTPYQVEKLRTEKGHADPYEWSYTFNSIPCAVEIQPALIKQRDGGYKAFFPGVTEELVEEALKKILTDQQYGIHDPEQPETWVKFSLRMVAKELRDRGRTRSLDQIKHAIKVMSGCILTFYKDGKEIWQGSILQDLLTSDREEYLKDSNSLHAARLPLFISHAINQLEYRQFNYDRLMRCNDQLTRWIYKKLIHRYVNANHNNDYHFSYSSLERDSGLLQQGRATDNRKKVIKALKELASRDVLKEYVVEERKEGQKIIDIIYTVRPSFNFVREQKAANSRARDGLVKAGKKGTKPRQITLEQTP